MGENYDTDKDLDRFKGLEINGGGIDEINECQEATLYKMLERSGSWNNAEGRPPIVVLGTCNPANNWVKEEVYDRWIKGTLPETWAYIPSKITDNPYIPDDYLNSLKANMPEYEYLRFVEGDWEVQEKPENPFFTAFEPKDHESADTFFNPNLPILFAFDFNLQPFAGIVAHKWKDDNGEHFHIVDEFSVPDGSIPKMIDTIKEKYEPYLPMCQITGDAMGKRGDLSQRDNANYYEQLARGLKLSGKQIRVQDNPKHENSRAECNYILRHYPDFKVNPKSCPNTSRDLRMLKCDAMGNIIKRNRNIITQLADHGDCFAEGTMIATPFGSTPIQNIKIGYLVNTPNGQKRVLDAWNSVADIYEVTFSDGSVIFCTKDHKFYTENNEFVPISGVFEQKILVKRHNSDVYVLSMRFSRVDTVYDITVDEENCFYANGILVHNCVRYICHTFLGEWYIYHLKKSGYKNIPL